MTKAWYHLQLGVANGTVLKREYANGELRKQHILSGISVPTNLYVNGDISANWISAGGKSLNGTAGVIIKGGSIVRTVYEGTSYPLFSDSDMSAILGVSNSNVTNTIVFFENGDGAAQSVHIDGSTHLNNTWYATANRGMAAAPLRINWLAVYFG